MLHSPDKREETILGPDRHIDPAVARRSPTRRFISLGLGVLMAAGGSFAFLWMLLFSVEPIKVMIWLAPITVSVVGIAIVWDDLRNP
jgi:hypothetical protein